MSKKQPSAVAAAQTFAAYKHAELEAAKTVVATLTREYGEAMVAVRAAKIEADALLPQCKLVTVRRHGMADESPVPVVILRKTAGGQLVVRYVGEPKGPVFRFKKSDYRRSFVQAEKESWLYSSHRELRDVPAEYMPADASSSGQEIEG